MPSTLVFTGDEEQGGIPPDSHIRLVILPSHRLVFDGMASEQLALTLDPGKYAYVVSKMRDDPAPAGKFATELQYNGEFLHDIKEEDFDTLQRLKPQAASFRLTSDGGLWFCKMGWGCKFKTLSEITMVLHEADHVGITKDDLIANKKSQSAYLRTARKAAEKASIEEDVAKRTGMPAKRPGRPAKSV